MGKKEGQKKLVVVAVRLKVALSVKIGYAKSSKLDIKSASVSRKEASLSLSLLSDVIVFLQLSITRWMVVAMIFSVACEMEKHFVKICQLVWCTYTFRLFVQLKYRTWSHSMCINFRLCSFTNEIVIRRFLINFVMSWANLSKLAADLFCCINTLSGERIIENM